MWCSFQVTPTDYIPPAPPLPDSQISDVPDVVLNALGEPALSSMGLAGWSPSGCVQQALEGLHASLGLPWWEAIVIGECVCVCVCVCVYVCVCAVCNQVFSCFTKLASVEDHCDN